MLLISINLAFINACCAIPGMLDGGLHLVFLFAAEAVRRKPACAGFAVDGMGVQDWHGPVFVLALMLFVTINDIVSLPIFGS